MLTEQNLKLLTENKTILLDGWQNLTNKQYEDASKGIGRIDRNGDYHAKKEVTSKFLKKQKASDRIKAEKELAFKAFKNIEAEVIKSANSVYAGKNNIAKIEADPDADKSYSSKVETNYSGKGFRVDPMYLYVLITDINGGKAHIRVDSRPSSSKDVYVKKEDGCSISDEYLNKIGSSIANFMHSKIRKRHENSRRYEDEIREKIARHHANSPYPNGYTSGAEHELRRRGYLGEDVLDEELLEEGKMKAAVISLAMAITSSLIGAGIINGNKERVYNNELAKQLTMQASGSDIARGRADFMFDGNRIQYDAGSNVLKINGKKMKESKAVKNTSLNGDSVNTMRGAINTTRRAGDLKNLQKHLFGIAGVSYDSNSDTFVVRLNNDKRDIGNVSNAKNMAVKLGYKIVKAKGASFVIQKK